MKSPHFKQSDLDTNHFLSDGDKYAARRPTYPLALAKSLSNLCEGTQHALDVGCGTGQFSLLLAEYFDAVSATDPSASQITNAIQHPKVTYRCEPAECIGTPDTSVDLLTAAQAAHWFDLNAFYSEARRVLRPNGVIALISYGVPELSGQAGKLFHRFYWQDIHSYWPKGRMHVEQGYHTLDFPFDEIALEPIEIHRSWNLHDLLGYIETWSSIKKAKEAGAVNVVEKFKNELSDQWGHSEEIHDITWPIAGRVARWFG